jgi:hypothetical protein
VRRRRSRCVYTTVLCIIVVNVSRENGEKSRLSAIFVPSHHSKHVYINIMTVLLVNMSIREHRSKSPSNRSAANGTDRVFPCKRVAAHVRVIIILGVS